MITKAETDKKYATAEPHMIIYVLDLTPYKGLTTTAPTDDVASDVSNLCCGVIELCCVYLG